MRQILPILPLDMVYTGKIGYAFRSSIRQKWAWVNVLLVAGGPRS